MGFECCNDNAISETDCSCNKEHYDNDKPEHWIKNQVNAGILV